MTVRVEKIGHRGDGIAETEKGPIYIPFTSPGDLARVRVREGRGVLRGILEPGPSRRKPVCQHFGQCGGCALQHVDLDDYLDWKQRMVSDALAHRGLDVAVVDPIIAVPPGERRRAKFTAVRRAGVISFGYNVAASHEVIDIAECPLIVTRILEALPELHTLTRAVLKSEGRVSVTVTTTQNGLDVMYTADQIESWDLLWEQRKSISDCATRMDLARLAINDDVLVLRRRPSQVLSGCEMVPPPGAFLQASPQAEAKMTQLVCSGVGAAKRVADLFSGCGTFSFALAKRSRVLAVDGDKPMLEALGSAAARADGLMEVETEVRNLFVRPLLAAELKDFDAVVFDPPRAGAKFQAECLAEGDVARIVAVSCNPSTFARDARILVDGGYSLNSVTPIDQFVWSPHIELVGVFVKG